MAAPKWVVLQPWTCHCGQPNVGPAPCSACLNAAPPTSAAGAPPPEPPRHPWLRAIALLTAVVLLAGVVSAFLVGTDDGDGPVVATEVASDASIPPEGRTVEVAPDTEPGPDAGALERALPGLMRFTQEARGLSFKVPVRVTLLPDQAFRARLKEAEDEDVEERREELQTLQRVLEGLGLLEKGVDLEAAVDSLYGTAVAGLYDPEKDDLVVRGDTLTVSVRATLVHEFVHALQDQHFDLGRTDLDDRPDDAALGFDVLAEGDAVRIEELYLESLSNRERKEAERDEAEAVAGIDPDIPRVVLQLVAFPYLVGPEFARAVVRAEGQSRLDQAFVEPPASSEQLLHPEAFLKREPIIPVEVPLADGPKIDDGVFGELDLLLVLNTGGGSARTAAEGWGGGRYVVWRDGDDTCVRATLVMDTLQDDAELRSALDRIAADRDRFEVEGKGPITFTSCN